MPGLVSAGFSPRRWQRWLPGFLSLLFFFGFGAGLLAEGENPQGYLGIKIRSVPNGARVIEVFAGSPGEKAGLSEGDVIVRAGETWLAGKTTKEITTYLRGTMATEVELELSPFPGTGETTTLKVVRGPAIDRGDSGKKGGYFPEWERAANLISSGLRGPTLPEITPSVELWKLGSDRAGVDQAILRMLREASGTWWLQAPRPPAQQRHEFWKKLGADADFQALLLGRDPPTRLAAALLLARHSGTTTLATALLKGLPEPLRSTPEAVGATSMINAITRGDVSGLAKLMLPNPDLVTGDQRRGVGLLASDVAALELACDLQGEDKARELLPEEVIRRLETNLSPLPWVVAAADLPAFGVLPPVPAPAIDVPRVGEGRLVSADHHEGLLVVSFWATWCGPCRQELPRLQALSQELADTGLQVWALSLDDDASLVPPFLTEQGLTLTAGIANPQLRDQFGVGPIPRLFVLDAQNRIVLDHTGYSETSFDHLAGEIRGMAKGQLPLERHLGVIPWGDSALELAGVGHLNEPPTAFFPHPNGDLWVADDDFVRPLRMVEGHLEEDEDRRVPLAFPAELLRWADLDGDGSAELIAAAEGGYTLRVSHPDGRVKWSLRGREAIVALGIWRDGGTPRIGVVRLSTQQVADPRGPLPDGSSRPTVTLSRPHLDLHDDQGQLEKSLDIPGDLVALIDDPLEGQLAVTSSDGTTWRLEKGPQLKKISPDWIRTRGVGFVPGSEDILAAGSIHTMLWGRTGPGGSPSLLAITGGGDVFGVDNLGNTHFHLDLQRRPRVAVADLDHDGREEWVLYTPWFGLAALHTTFAAFPTSRKNPSLFSDAAGK